MIHPESHKVLKRLDHWGEEHDTVSRQFADAVRRAALARHAFELAWAKAVRRAPEGRVADQEAFATVETDQIERLRSWNSATNQSIRDTGVAA